MEQVDYIPQPAIIDSIRPETPTEKGFTLRFTDGEPFHFHPGQFAEVSVFGAGEAPFCIASSPAQTDAIQIVVRRYPEGMVTAALHQLQVGDYVGVRGPLGNGFPVEENRGRDIIIVAGGIGLPAVRATILYLLDHRSDYRNVTLLYGARTPADRVYKDDLEVWEGAVEIVCQQTVDVKDEHETWDGKVGFVTELIKEQQLEPEQTAIFMCGPAPMIRPAASLVQEMAVPSANMWISMVAHMKCGVGKCGHCTMKDKYVCLEGPIFRYDEIQDIQQFQEAL